MPRNILYLVAALSLVILATTACEIERSAGGQWHKLPELTKPRVSSNTDQGGEFRRALVELAEVKLAEGEKIKAVITTWDLAYFAGGMASDIAEIRIVVSEPVNLYTYTPDHDTVLAMLKDAHVLFKIGLGLDDWIDPIFEEAKLTNPKLIKLDLPRNIDLIGDQWNTDPTKQARITNYNPWFWLDPDNMMSVADTFYQIFLTFRPEKDEAMRKSTDILQHNYAIFPSSQQQLKALKGKIVIQDVPIWPYFAKYFDMTITDTIMPDGKTPPTQERLKTLANLAKENKVVAIIKSKGYGDAADQLAKESSLPIIELDPHPRMADSGMDDFFQQIMGNANRLLMKFRELKLEEVKIEEPKPEAPPQGDVQLSDEQKKALEEKVKEAAEGKAKEEAGKSGGEKKPDDKKGTGK